MRVRLTCLLWLLAIGGADQAVANWHEPVAGSLNVSSSLAADSASTTTAGGVPYVAWDEDNGSVIYQIRVKRLEGTAWAAVGGSLNLSTDHNAYSPSIASVGGVPYVAWQEDDGAGHFQIRVKRVEAGSWTAVGGSLNLDPSHDAGGASIADIGGIPYVAWREYNGSRNQIRVKRLEGNSWVSVGISLNVSQTDPANAPNIADVAGVPFVAWQEITASAAEVHVARLDGASWTAVGGALNASATEGADAPSIMGIGGLPYVAWPEGNGPARHLYVKRLDGNAWAPVGASPENAPGSLPSSPSLADFGGVPVVAFDDFAGSNYRVYAKRFDGSAWVQVGSGPLNVAGDRSAERPSVNDVGGVPYVAWDEYDASDVQQISVKRLEPDIGAESASPSATGATLSAQVDDFGLRLPIGFEFGTTPAFGTQTALQSTSGAGASTVTQDITGLTPQTAYSFRAFGSDGARQTSMGATQTFTTLAAGGAPPPLALPVISNLKLTPATFRAAKGTVVTYNDSVAATTTLTVQRPTIGRRKGGKCVKARTRPPRAKRCTRYVKVRSLKHVDVAGGNRLRLKGRGLKPGAYRLRAVARNAAGAGKPATRRFRVKR